METQKHAFHYFGESEETVQVRESPAGGAVCQQLQSGETAGCKEFWEKKQTNKKL